MKKTLRFTVLFIGISLVLFTDLYSQNSNQAIIDSFPYFQNFNSTNDWLSGGSNSTWVLDSAGFENNYYGYFYTNNYDEVLSSRHFHVANWGYYEDSYIESPYYDFTNLSNPVLEMKLMLLLTDTTTYLYTSYPGEQFAWIEYSTDGGVSFNNLGSQQTGFNWYDETVYYYTSSTNVSFDAWIYDKYPHQFVSHDLQFLTSEDSVKFRVRFCNTSYTSVSHFVSVDDVFIYDKPNYDASLVEIISPEEYSCNFSDSTYLSVKITNKGLQPISNFEVGAKTDSSLAIIETFTGTINSGDTVVYNFLNPIDLSRLGKFNLICWAKTAGENHFTDDTLKTELFHVPYISDFPYHDDFESDIFWKPSGSTSTWTVDNDSAWWGKNSTFWHTNTPDAEMFNEQSLIESPCFSFSNLIHPMVELEIIQNSEQGYVWMEVSSDNGNTWETVGNSGDLLYWYNNNSFAYPPTIPAWYSGITPYSDLTVTDSWHFVKHSLDNFAGMPNVKFRIRGNGQHGQGYGGLHFGFDNFKIYEAPQFDIGILDVYNLENCFSTDTNSLVVEIYNMGYEAATNFELSCKFENNSWTSIICTDTVFPDSTIIVSADLLNGIPLTANYSLSVAVSHPNDTISENDSILNLQITNLSYDFTENPYLTHFTSYINGTVNPKVTGWTYINADTNDCYWYIPLNGNDEYCWLKNNYNYSNCITIDDYLVSPCFQLDTAKLYELRFKLSNNEIIDSLRIVYGSSATASDLNNLIEADSQLPASGMTDYSYLFSVSQPDIYYVGIHVLSDSIPVINIRFDDFSLQEIYPYDTKISDISTLSSCQLSNIESVILEINNAGFNSVSNIPVFCRINDSILLSGNYADTIPAGQTAQYQLPTNVDLSANIIHNLEAWTELANDENFQNDTLQNQISSLAPISNFPYEEDFENEHFWAIGGKNSTWGQGNLASTDYNPTVNFNATNFLTTKFNGESFHNEVSWVESPCFDISGLAFPYIEFDLFTTESLGALSFQFSLDGGNSWQLFGGILTGYYWYDVSVPIYAYNLYENFDVSYAWTETSIISFENFSGHLDSLAGATSVKFRFIYASDIQHDASTISAIDNFKIYDRIPGCTNPEATNYDSTAMVDDGSCIYNCYASASFSYTDLGYNTYLFTLNDSVPDSYSISWYLYYQTNAVGDSVYFTYPTPTNIPVSCTVSSPYDYSCSDVQVQTVYVTDCALNSHFSVNEIDSGEFVFELLYPEFPFQNSIEWDFGDGETASGIDSVYHKYDTLGTYSVSCERIYNNQTYCSDYIDTLLEVTALSHEFQTFIFNSGWSIFSTYLQPIDTNISDALSNWQNVDIIKDEFGNVYWPAFGINFIGQMTDGLGYQVKMANSSNYYIAGYLIDPQATPLSLDIGWHIIAYLRQNPGDFSTMLQTISGAFVLIKDEFGDVYWPAYGINYIGNMLPGEGYQIKMSQAAVLTYPAN